MTLVKLLRKYAGVIESDNHSVPEDGRCETRIDFDEERAAIKEFDAGFTRKEAERQAQHH